MPASHATTGEPWTVGRSLPSPRRNESGNWIGDEARARNLARTALSRTSGFAQEEAPGAPLPDDRFVRNAITPPPLAACSHSTANDRATAPVGVIATPRMRSSACAEADDRVRVERSRRSFTRDRYPPGRRDGGKDAAACKSAASASTKATVSRRFAGPSLMAQRDDVIGVTARNAIRQRRRLARRRLAIWVLSGRNMPVRRWDRSGRTTRPLG